MERSVLTRAFPPAGTTVSSALLVIEKRKINGKEGKVSVSMGCRNGKINGKEGKMSVSVGDRNGKEGKGRN